MSKPDFFLPFHLPMVLPDNDILNIACDMTDVDSDFKRGIYRCRTRYGIYQTMEMTVKIISPYKKIMSKFSISLN